MPPANAQPGRCARSNAKPAAITAAPATSVPAAHRAGRSSGVTSELRVAPDVLLEAARERVEDGEEPALQPGRAGVGGGGSGRWERSARALLPRGEPVLVDPVGSDRRDARLLQQVGGA